MNHSCCPNVIVTYKGTLAEVRAVQEIGPGEEVSARPWVAGAVSTRRCFERQCGETTDETGRVFPAVAPGPSSGLPGLLCRSVTCGWESHVFGLPLVLAISIQETNRTK